MFYRILTKLILFAQQAKNRFPPNSRETNGKGDKRLYHLDLVRRFDKNHLHNV